MAKIQSLLLSTKAEAGAVMIVRDYFAEIVDDETSPYFGERPPLLAADGTPVTLTLLGTDSQTAKRFDYQLQADATNRASAFFATNGKRKGFAATPEDKAQEAARRIDRMVALTTDWHGFEDEDDQPIPFSPDAVRSLYEQNLLIFQDAEQFVSDRARFFARSSTSSAPSSTTSSE